MKAETKEYIDKPEAESYGGEDKQVKDDKDKELPNFPIHKTVRS